MQGLFVRHLSDPQFLALNFWAWCRELYLLRMVYIPCAWLLWYWHYPGAPHTSDIRRRKPVWNSFTTDSLFTCSDSFLNWSTRNSRRALTISLCFLARASLTLSVLMWNGPMSTDCGNDFSTVSFPLRCFSISTLTRVLTLSAGLSRDWGSSSVGEEAAANPLEREKERRKIRKYTLN